MLKIRSLAIAAVLVASALPASATQLNCAGGRANMEEFRYSWRIRGGLRWIAGLIVPTSGSGNLRTVFPTADTALISSELLITAPEGKAGGYYLYESEMDPSGLRTLMTYSGYQWGRKIRHERINFDYAKRLARIRKETEEKTENRVKPLPDGQMRDVLTAIYFLRRNADRITTPITTNVYSDGKEYPVVFRPMDRKTFEIDGRRVSALGFEIVDAPGGRKFPGNVRVYISDDARRVPFRIDIMRAMSSLQLDLTSIEACGFMQALH